MTWFRSALETFLTSCVPNDLKAHPTGMHAYRSRSNTCVFCSLRSDLLSWRAIPHTPPPQAKRQQTRAFSATAHHQRIRKYTAHPYNGEGIEEHRESRIAHSRRRAEHKGVDEYRPLLDLSFGAKPPIIRKGVGEVLKPTNRVYL